MSRKLDEELAEAIAGGAPAPEQPRARRDRVARPHPRSVGLLLTLLLLAGVVVTMFLAGDKASVYAMSIDELAGDKAKLVGRRVRAEGELVPGTLVKREKPCEYRFVLQRDQARIPVRYEQCAIPDGLRDMPGGGVMVTIEGALDKDGEFEASLVMAKCASKYDPKTHKMSGG